MKKLFLYLILCFLAIPFTVQSQHSTTEETILIFVRHAEKIEDGTNNPSLNEKGTERAEKLAKLLKARYDVEAIYSTPYKRTLETAKPLANALNMTILEYDLKDPNKLISGFIDSHKGETILVVGHSNTTPLLVNITLGNKKYAQLGEYDYNSIFVVKLAESGEVLDQKFTY